MTAAVEPEAPCRTCTDMKDFLEKRGFKLPWGADDKPTNDANTAANPNPVKADATTKDCPLDRAALGRQAWGVLHTMAAYYPAKPSPSEQEGMTQFMHRFAQFYPCATCRTHLQSDLKKFPPAASSRHLLSQWMCELHNRVNRRLGKTLFDCSKVDERWRTGPKDGSCG